MQDNPKFTSLDPSEAAPRLTLRHLMHGFAERFLSLEHGWLRTARELTTAPGPMIRRYVEGHRRDYANPFAYLVATHALSFVVQILVGYRQRIMEGLPAGSDQTPAQAALINHFVELMMANTLYVSLGFFVPLAVLLRLFFRRSGFNLAEMLVFTLYTAGHVTLLGAVVMASSLVLRTGPLANTVIGFALAVGYTAWATRGFFPGSWPARVLKVGTGYLVSYGLMLLVISIATMAWVLSFGVGHSTGEDWNLVTAAERNATGVVQTLLTDGADLTMTRDRTALHVAVEMGHAEIVDLLIEHGADLNARDHLGRVPLFVAVAARRPEIVLKLREAATDATARTSRGTSLLYVALRRGDPDTARWALDNGADVNAVRADSERATALMVAAAKGDLEMVTLLIERGADPTIANPDGKTALDLARGEEVKHLLSGAGS